MGLNFGSSKSKSTAVQGNVKVWAPQEPYLRYGMGEATGAYQAQKGSPWYQGDLYAGFDPAMLQSIMDRAKTFSNTANPAIDNLTGVGNQFLNFGSKAMMDALSDPNGAQSMGDAYANSPMANSLVDAGTRDIKRVLTEEALPSSRLAAIGSGNSGSSRAAITEALLQRGAEDRIADTGAGIRNNLFNQGVDQFNNRIAQLGNLFSAGSGSLAQALGLQGQNQEQLAQAGGLAQADQQGDLDAKLKAWLGQDTRATDLLSRLWSVIGGNIGQSPGFGTNSSSSGFNFGITAKSGN